MLLCGRQRSADLKRVVSVAVASLDSSALWLLARCSLAVGSWGRFPRLRPVWERAPPDGLWGTCVQRRCGTIQLQEHAPPLPVLPNTPSPCDGAALCLSIQAGRGVDLDPGQGIGNLGLIATGKDQPRAPGGQPRTESSRRR